MHSNAVAPPFGLRLGQLRLGTIFAGGDRILLRDLPDRLRLHQYVSPALPKEE